MLRIRLQRKGRKKRPIWHLVVADSRSPRDGRIIEQVGRYDNVTEKKEVILNEDRIFYWLDSGAQPSDTVRKILRREGLLYKRHLMGWGKSEEEIEASLSEWKSYRDSKDSSEVSRKEQYQSILDAEEKEYKKQLEQKASKAAAEVKAEKAQEEAEATSAEDEATAEQGDTSATVEKEKTAEDTAAKAVETETEEETGATKDAAEAKAEKPAGEDVDEPVAAETETEAEKIEEPEASAKEAAEAVEEEVADVAEPPATEEAKEEVAEEPAAEEETKAETSGKTSTELTAKEAIDHINDTDLADLEGFVTGDEDRVTVQRAWETKQEG
ncbi:MAG: 30S ribosomal protein S16 [Balneolaceae bacterium]